MANSNVNIAKKLFAYIQHKADLTTDMVEMYNNSLIFLGDEKQIFVPVMNTYVGVGMTSYNTIIDELNKISSKIQNLTSSATNNSVTKIYSQIDETDTGGLNSPYFLNNEITIKGIDSYNWANGTVVEGAGNENKRKVERKIYTVANDADGISDSLVTVQEEVNLTDTFAGGSYSGITITAVPTGKVPTGDTDDNGNPIYTQGRNVLKIDDSITWAYITSKNSEISDAYKRYTNDEINRIYQTIVGTDKDNKCYVPVSYTQIQLDENSGSQYYYKTIAADGTATWSRNPMTAQDILATNWAEATSTGEDVPGDVPQFYLLVAGDNAYNLGDVDIRNGINTLKEVAYTLDILTDGMAGDVTYITKAAYDSLTPEQSSAVTYYLVTENSGPENYAYYVTMNAENLGIKMAYSIYGNQVQIDEVRDHIKALETGKTTLRSIDSDTDSQYGSLVISTQDNHQGPVDFNSGLPFDNESDLQSNIAYFGDAKVKLHLNITEVYVKTKVAATEGTPGTSDSVVYPSSAAVTLNGVKTIGIYQKADKNNLDTDNIIYYTANAENDTITLTKVDANTASSTNSDLYFIHENSVAGDTVLYEWTNDNKSATYILDHPDKIYGSKDNNGNWTIYSNANDAAAAAGASTPVLVYQVTDESMDLTSKLFGVVPSNNEESHKLASSEWVLSLIGDVSDNPSTGSGTPEEIDLSSLNYEHKYADFDRLFWDTNDANSIKTGLTEGTAAYQAKYDEWYDVFKNGTVTESGDNVTITKDSKTITLTKSDYYASNRFNTDSKIINIVNQKDGKVSAESRELPTDEIVAKVNVWGEEESTNPKGYEDIPSSVYTSGDVIANLFAFNKDHESEVFIKFGTTHKEIPSNSANITEQDFNSISPKYWYNSALNEYTQIVGGGLVDEPYSDYANYTTKQGWLRWRQLYQVTDKYVNLDLNSATIENGVLHLKDVVGNDYEITDSTTLYYASVPPQQEVKYLTTESKHFDYAHGGHGENRLEVTANIVKLEDASATNSGFADAFDVKSYIDNLIEWVNLSASVSESDLVNPVFYEVIPANTTVSTDYYKKVVNGDVVTMTPLTSEDVTTANAENSSWKANGKWISGHEVYRRVQNVVENPINLTKTRLVNNS